MFYQQQEEVVGAPDNINNCSIGKLFDPEVVIPTSKCQRANPSEKYQFT
jgi:hypothetical protein